MPMKKRVEKILPIVAFLLIVQIIAFVPIVSAKPQPTSIHVSGYFLTTSWIVYKDFHLGNGDWIQIAKQDAISTSGSIQGTYTSYWYCNFMDYDKQMALGVIEGTFTDGNEPFIGSINVLITALDPSSTPYLFINPMKVVGGTGDLVSAQGSITVYCTGFIMGTYGPQWILCYEGDIYLYASN